MILFHVVKKGQTCVLQEMYKVYAYVLVWLESWKLNYTVGFVTTEAFTSQVTTLSFN